MTNIFLIIIENRRWRYSVITFFMAYIWKISIVEFKNKCLVDGIVLEGTPPVNKQRIGSLKNFARVIISYFRKPYSEKKISLFSNNKQVDIVTDKHGGFNLELDHKIDTNFKIIAEDQSLPLKIAQTYPLFFKESEYPVNIISDVDDTILVSHTASLWKRVTTLLFVSPYKREKISFTLNILNKIRSNNGRIFYVSKSEGNLFGPLSSFIENKDLPTGNLMLTPYLRFKQLLHPQKGKDYKLLLIKSIIENSPDKQFILIGDDTQQDIIVYTRIAELFPHQIIKIYIRKTRKNLFGNKKEQMNKLLDLAVPTLYFSDDSDPAEEINFIENHQIT